MRGLTTDDCQVEFPFGYRGVEIFPHDVGRPRSCRQYNKGITRYCKPIICQRLGNIYTPTLGREYLSVQTAAALGVELRSD